MFYVTKTEEFKLLRFRPLHFPVFVICCKHHLRWLVGRGRDMGTVLYFPWSCQHRPYFSERQNCLISEVEIQDVPRRTIIVKNKLAASTYLAPSGNSSKPTDEASLQNPLSQSQQLTPAPLAERSVAVAYKCGQKGRSGKAWCGLSHKGNRRELWPHP